MTLCHTSEASLDTTTSALAPTYVEVGFHHGDPEYNPVVESFRFLGSLPGPGSLLAVDLLTS